MAASNKVNEETFRSWDPGEVNNFLLDRKVVPSVAQKLLDENADGNALLDLDENELKDVIGILQSKVIKKHVNTFITNVDTGPTKLLTPKQKKSEIENVRKFDQPVKKGFSYTSGNLVQHEIGAGNLLEPSREFKEFVIEDKTNIANYEIPFIKRVAQFSTACLNRRCNGTIYFGVADSINKFNKNGVEYKHGEIVGIDLDIDQVDIFEDWIKKYFRGKNSVCLKNFNNDEMKTALDQSIKPIRVIPLNDNKGVVFEIDVVPTSAYCKEIIFPVQIPKDETHKKMGDTLYFCRSGPSSDQIPKKDIKGFMEKTLLLYVNARREQENKEKLQYEDTSVKLTHLLCKSENFINDEEYKYFLIADCINQNLSTDISEHLNWISNINWQAILDFDSQSFQCGLGKYVEEDMLKPPKKYKIEELADMLETKSLDKIRKEISYGHRCSWLMCNEVIQDFKTWFLGQKGNINKALNFFTNSRNTPSQDRLVFVFALFSHESMTKIAEIIKDIVEICKGFNEIVILYQDENVLKFYQERLIEIVGTSEWNNYSIKISWEQLSSFVKTHNQYKECTELLVPSASGVPIAIKPKIVDHFKKDGLHILGINQCDDLRKETNANKQENLAKEHTQNFLTGKNPSWEIFMLSEPDKNQMRCATPSGLVEREITKNIQKLISNKKQMNNKLVSFVGILHNPGAGATTVGKHVLWKMKEDFRCAYLDGDFFESSDIESISNRILFFRKIGEPSEDSKCCPVLLFLDNSSPELGMLFRKQIELSVNNSKIKDTSTMVIILYAERSVDLKSRQEEKVTPNLFPLRSSLDRNERVTFKRKLEQLKKHRFSPDDMLSFVIMAEDFNEDSEYVQKLVKNNLKDVHQYPKQEMLLMVLSVYKLFSEGNLPVSLCNKYLGHSSATLQERLCFQLKPLIEIKPISEEGYGNYDVLHVTHLPVAKQVLHLQCERNETSEQEILLDFLNHPSVQQGFLRQKIFDDIRTLLISRVTGDGSEEVDHKKLLFSKLILHIQNKISPENALDLLKTGFETLQCDSRIAQTIARFLLHQQHFLEAKEWAKKAIDLEKNNHSFLDTMGQVYRHELKHLKEKKKINFPTEMEYAIGVAQKAVEYFKEAQDLLEMYCKNNRATNDEDFEEESNNRRVNLPQFGEIGVNMLLSEILLMLTENMEKKKSIVKFLQGMDVENEVEGLFAEKIHNWMQYGSFISEIDKRTIHCMNQILNTFDSSTFLKKETKVFDPIRVLTQYREKRESMLFGTQYNDLHNFIKSKKPLPLKLKMIREALNCKLVRNMIYCFHRDHKEISGSISLIDDLFSICPEKDLVNEDKLCFLNIHFAEYYKFQETKITFNQMCSLSFQLALNDFPSPEPYFFYMITHWPNEDKDNDNNTEYLDTYDEGIMVKSIWKMKEIQDETDKYFVPGKKFKQGPFRRPFFFLGKNKGFSKLDIVSQGGVGNKFFASNKNRKVLYGTITCDNIKRILYTFPKGKTFNIRPTYQDLVRDKNTREVSFELGFTLEGPVAYNIKPVNSEDDRLSKYNAS